MKCKLCPICLTDNYDLIRNCELRGSKFPDCEANNLPAREGADTVVIDWPLRTGAKQ